jgi:hypothetical protein
MVSIADKKQRAENQTPENYGTALEYLQMN